MKKVIALVGPIASGKDVTKKYLEEKCNAKTCKYSTSLRDVLDRLEIPKERENLQKLSTILRQNFGENLLAKVITKDAREIEGEFVVLDGVRRPTDILYAKELEGFVLISIDANPEIRYERMKIRNENVGDDKKTFEEFQKMHEAESELLIPNLMQDAKFTIDNNGSFEDLYKQIDQIFNSL